MKRTHLILKLQVSETFHKRFQTSSQVLCKALRGQCREKETRRRERRVSKCVITLWSNYHCSFVKIILRCFIKRDRLLFCSRANLHLHSAVASSKIPTRSGPRFTTLCKKHDHAVSSLQPATYVYAMIWPRADATQSSMCTTHHPLTRRH